MRDQWQLLKTVKEMDSGKLEAEACAPEGSLWFSGHFPGEPILPGIALISVAEQAIIKDAAARGEKVRIKSLRRIRFTQPVRPGENLAVEIAGEKAEEETLFNFKVAAGQNIVCTGLIVVEKIRIDK